MRNSSFTVLEKNLLRRSSLLSAAALIVVATLGLGNPGIADDFRFRVVFEHIPGVGDIEMNNIQAGIDILEEQLKQVEQGDSGEIWTTLCAAYILNISLDQAEHACTQAVELNPTYPAYNNRGVFRVHTGDLSGAREDFERVRPFHMEAYIDELKTTDESPVWTRNTPRLL